MSRTALVPLAALAHPVRLLGLGFGSGLSPVLPGTAGTAVAIPFYLVMQHLPLWTYLAVVAAAWVAGLWICEVTGRYLGDSDHPAIVWDELVGFWITMLAAPPGWPWIVYGFLLFRFADIAKVWPCNLINDRVHSAFGAMADDTVAGAYALAVLQLTAYLLAAWGPPA